MVNLTSKDQQIYNKILGTKSKMMSADALYAEFGSVPKASVMASCEQLLKLQLLQTVKPADGGAPLFKAKSLEEAKRTGSATWTQEQKLVHSVIKEAQRNGISLSGIKRKVAVVSMNPVILRKALEGLIKLNIIKTFKPINSPTMSMYILAGLSPPEEVTGGVWYNANQGYDTALVQAICQVLLKRTHDLTFPKISDKDEESGKAPIYAFAKARLPSPHTLLNFIKDKRLTTAPLSVKNVMECMRALELDGKVETIKPMSMGHFDIGDDEPGPSKRRKVDDGDSSSEDDSRKEKEKQKAKEKAKEKKRRAREKEKKEKEKKEKEKKKRKKEKKKEKEKENKKKKKAKEKGKKRAGSDDEAGSDTSDLRAIDDDDDEPVKKRKRRSPSVSSASSSSSSESDDDDTSSDSDSDDVSSVASDDIDEGYVAFKPESSGLPLIMSNPFDLSDTQIVYRATRRLDNSVMLGQMHTPCGRCPQFTFCEESGPVNAAGCEYYDGWLGDRENAGGWERGTALHKMRPELKAEEDEAEAQAEAQNGAINGDTNGHGHDVDMGMDMDVEQDYDAGDHLEEEPALAVDD